MASVLMDGQIDWSMTKDEEGHREYKIIWLVYTDSPFVGPAEVSRTPGLPTVGSSWSVDGDVDVWAFCKPQMTCRPVLTKEPNYWWTVEQTFSTKPPDDDKERCQDTEIEDPLLEPFKLNISYSKRTKEATHDRQGNPILTSSHEMIRGPHNEWDLVDMVIDITQNVPDMDLSLLNSMVNTVNDNVLWTFPARCVKLAPVTIERKFYGGCNVYYTRHLKFETNSDSWDRELLDEGTKALNGRWGIGEVTLPFFGVINEGTDWVLVDIGKGAGAVVPDKTNPAHFSQFKDRRGENTKVILNEGYPMDSVHNVAGRIHVEKYEESNFLLLGIPAIIE